MVHHEVASELFEDMIQHLNEEWRNGAKGMGSNLEQSGYELALGIFP